MNDTLPGSKIAEQMLTGPGGATMRELIAATGGPQYNVLKRLESRGCTVRKTREGRETRYHIVAPKPVYELSVSDKGQVTLPKGLRDEMRVYEGQKLEASMEDGRIVIAPKTRSIRDLFGMLPKPKAHLSDKQIQDAIADAAVTRFKRVGGRDRS